MQTACARPGEVLAFAPLDDGDVNPRKRQLGRQHQPRRTTSSDNHRMLFHGRYLYGMNGGLPQAPMSGIRWKWREAGVALLFSFCACLLTNSGRAKFGDTSGSIAPASVEPSIYVREGSAAPTNESRKRIPPS